MLGACAVHVLTAAGAGLALLALLAAARAEWSRMFLWLGIAALVDGIDGPLARRLRVNDVAPRWSGDILDLVVDFSTYVFVPAFVLTTSGILPAAMEVPMGLLIVMSGALYFADRGMKMAGHYFRGFPAIWNVAAFYLFILKPNPWAAAVALIGLALLCFAPVPFVHPLRVQWPRSLNMAMLAGWAILAAYALRSDLNPGFPATALLCAIGVYFVGIGLMRPARFRGT